MSDAKIASLLSATVQGVTFVTGSNADAERAMALGQSLTELDFRWEADPGSNTTAAQVESVSEKFRIAIQARYPDPTKIVRGYVLVSEPWGSVSLTILEN